MKESLIKDYLFATSDNLKEVDKDECVVQSYTIHSDGRGIGIEVTLRIPTPTIGFMYGMSEVHFYIDLEDITKFEMERCNETEETLQEADSCDTIWDAHKSFLGKF